MEAILHIQPITRQTQAPLHIGHIDHISYGEILTEDGENIGTPSSYMALGCPLHTPDMGSTRSHIPLVKTIEYVPDPLRDQGHIYSETLHYIKDKKLLIPYRTKIHSGAGQGLRLSHLPSLNVIRQDITGVTETVCDPRQEIVLDLLMKDSFFEKHRGMPLHDWLCDELTMFLSHYPVNELVFGKEPITTMVQNYVQQIKHTPFDLTPKGLKDIVRTIIPPSSSIPSHYFSTSPLERPFNQFKEHFINTGADFTLLKQIPVRQLSCIDYNPPEFKEVCEALDKIPLTDFNIDLVVNTGNEIEFYHEHLAINRFASFDDAGIYQYANNDLMDHFDFSFVNTLLGKFVHHHSHLDSELIDIIHTQPLKIKVMKTMNDEAAILLYRYDSDSKETPLCGVYFDIALQSLSPLSIIAESIPN